MLMLLLSPGTEELTMSLLLCLATYEPMLWPGTEELMFVVVVSSYLGANVVVDVVVSRHGEQMLSSLCVQALRS